MTFDLQALLAAGSGGLVGLVLALVGGGGSILAVPLLVYLVGVSPPQVAIGTSALAVAGSALINLGPHWRSGRIKWRCALVFSAAGVIGAIAGSSLAKTLDGTHLLVLFALLMLAVAATMFLSRGDTGNPEVRLNAASAGHLIPRLVVIGSGVGALSGFFGIGGGFLIVPGLMLATGMPLGHAVGTSLVAIAAFGAATATSYAVSGLIDWRLAAFFIFGGALGGLAGAGLGKRLARRRNALRITFATVVMAAGFYVLYRSVSALAG